MTARRLLLATLLALAAAAAPASAGTCLTESTKEARQDGGYLVVVVCSGATNPIALHSVSPAGADAEVVGTPTATDARFIYRPDGTSGMGRLEWSSDGDVFGQDFTISPTGNNPPRCNVVQDIAIGVDERAQGSVFCEDRDVSGNTRDAISVTAADPQYGRIEGQAVQPDQSVAFTYVLDTQTTATSDTVVFTAADAYQPNPKAVQANALVSFPANAAPNCPPVSAGTQASTAVAIAVGCTDANAGDALSYAVAGAPSGGTLSGTAPNLTYTPRNGFRGTDSFTVNASDGRTTVPITVTVTVSGLDKDGDGSPEGTDCDDSDPLATPGRSEILGNTRDEDCDGKAQPFVRLVALITPQWQFLARGTRVRKLVLRNLPAGARVELRCSNGKGTCPFTRVRLRPKATTLDVTRRFKRRFMSVGTRIEVRVTSSNRIGKVVRYTVRAGAKPKVTTLCLPPRATRARACGA